MGIELEWATVALAMIALDVASGFAGAVKEKKVNSDKMREGLWEKAGFIGLILLAAIIEFGCDWLSVNVSDFLPNTGVENLPLVAATCVFVIALEAVSVCEHLCTLNPAIGKWPVIRSLKKLESEIEGEAPGDGGEPGAQGGE